MVKAPLIMIGMLLAISCAAKDVPEEQAIKYKYLLFPEQCFDKIFTRYEFFDVGCLSKIASKILSIAIVTLSVTLKVPQMLAIHRSGSVAGLSFRAMFNEAIMYGFNIAYNVNKGTDFMLYGENIFILVQNWILLVMFTSYSKNHTFKQLLGYLVIFLLVELPLVSGLLPPVVFSISIYINICLIFLSRAPQIQLNYKNSSTGQLAWLTCFLNLAGSITRAFTYFISSSDWLYNLQNLEAFGLNAIIMGQIILYRKKKID